MSSMRGRMDGGEADLGDSEAGPDIADLNEEEFRSATDVFKDPNAFDFLSQHGAGTAQNLARESLYVKFDPLVAGRQSIMPNRASTAAHAANNNNARTVVEEKEEEEEEAENGAAEKDAPNDLIAMNSPSPAKTKARSSAEANAGSSPAMENGGGSSTTTSKISAEHRLEFEEQLLKKDSRIAELEKLVTRAAESNEQLRTEAERRKESEDQMKQVLKEYEKTISELISEKEKEKTRFEEERAALLGERDQAAEDLKNVETAFADVHRKYERTKTVVEGFKANEETLKRLIEESEVRLRKQEQRYEMLKAHAEETLDKANKEIENMARSQDTEMARLTAMLKKTEMKAASLERSVEQKAKENEELTTICDELISKVGGAGE